MFSAAEKEARHKAIRSIMIDQGLKALLFVGDTNVGPSFCGDLRYYSNNRLVFYRQVVVAFPDADPVLFAWSEVQRMAALKVSFISDCRLGEDLLAAAIKLLRERGITTGRVGISLDAVSAAWYKQLVAEFPEVEWVEAHDHIMKLRVQRSPEEAEMFRRGALLGDGGFEAALKVIRPGVTEYEIVAEIEHFARAHGAEEHFSLIGTVKFPFEGLDRFPMSCPSNKRVEAGELVLMEITPRYEGYWTQIVRVVNVGAPNPVAEKIHKVCVEAIRKGLEEFKPGKRISDVVKAMDSYVSSTGYLLKPPLGHICGVDLLEDRVSPKNDMVLTPGTMVVIHPAIFLPDGKSNFFWGETYLVTQDGYERLHKTGDELHNA
jgi:Xaa-Pro aminopeptidase